MFHDALDRKSVMDSINNKDVPWLQNKCDTRLPFSDRGVMSWSWVTEGLHWGLGGYCNLVKDKPLKMRLAYRR